MKIVKDEELIEEILYEWETVEKEKVVDTSRWNLFYRKVSKSPEGKFWSITWGVGATEYQEVDLVLYLVEVFPKTITKTIYVTESKLND